LILGLVAGFAGAADPVSFTGLLQEAGLQLHTPAGFRELAIEDDPLLPYEKRLLSPDGGLEVRYAIRPLDRIEIDYHDPHSSAPAPNDIFEMLFRSLSESLALGSHTLSRAYLPPDAHKQFNAGWAAVAVFDLEPVVSKAFHQGMLIAIHQNDKADAYTLFLTNDLKGQKGPIQALSNSLRFSRFDKDIHRPPSPEELKHLPMIPEEPENSSP